jgi:hypothetical protein
MYAQKKEKKRNRQINKTFQELKEQCGRCTAEELRIPENANKMQK